MNARLYFSTDTASPIEPIAELSVVRLLSEVHSDDGIVLPKGSVGAVLAVYGSGEAYSVEFMEPVYALVTVSNNLIELLGELGDNNSST